jgi:endoglucanase
MDLHGTKFPYPPRHLVAAGFALVLAAATSASMQAARKTQAQTRAQADSSVPSLGATPFHAVGGTLVDATGHEVRITGINWFGMETGTFAPHGLWARGMGEMLDQIASLGFNTIRLPYSNQLFDRASKPNGIDLVKNPELRGITGPQIMDVFISEAGQRGLKVILDRHRPTADAQSELWYTDHVSEQRWIDDWTMLASHYRGNPTVIGADLHNEPHGPASWGDGNPSTDWRMAAQRAGNAILQTNPDWLIIVEGIEHQGNDWYWWGGNLAGARQAPVQLSLPNQLVYSAHDYGPGVNQQQWFRAFDFPYNLSTVWRDHWAYLKQDGTAPVLLGEFGGRSVGQDAEGIWQRGLLTYIKEQGISYTYWSWNPNSGDTGGILLDDWTSINTDKLAILSAYQWPLLGQPSAAQPPPSPLADPAPADQLPAVPTAADQPSGPGAIGGPFDPDPRHVERGDGGPNDPDAAHRQARERDELLYLQQFGKPWERAAYVTTVP